MSKNAITRSTVNSEQYAAGELQSSGFDLSYSKHSSWLLGRLHIAGFQHCMPGDKISGSMQLNSTFNRIVTPMITPVRAMSYQVFLPWRAVDRTFMKGMTPTKLNGMSASWSAPTVSTKYLVDQILTAYGLKDLSTDEYPFYYILYLIFSTTANDITLSELAQESGYTVSNFLYGPNGIVSTCVGSLLESTGAFRQMSAPMYLEDALIDIANNITAKMGSADNPLSGSLNARDVAYNFLDTILSPFVGRYSYFAELKYNYVRPWDLYRIVHSVAIGSGSDYEDFVDLFDDTPMNEYPLRCMYAIWYELFRNVDLEPVSSNLPDWREFGSTSIFDMSAGGNLLYLIYRIRSWEKDMFTSAQVDDISRHVYAPIYANSASAVSGHNAPSNNLDTNLSADNTDVLTGGSKPSNYDITYIDQLSGEESTVKCPVPANINDVLSALDINDVDVFGLDLNTLRQSQMLERYLKRNYLFGDEYQDRLLAHYNSRLSDLRINRPEVIGQSISDYNPDQEVSNVSTEETKVGQRTATATLSLDGDGYTTYCEEFGTIITILSFMPRPMYDGVCPQLLCTKQDHFPIPEFAANNEEFGRKMEIASSGLKPGIGSMDENNSLYMFGRYPAYHAWRSRVDDIGGMFLDELQDSTFRRFWGMYSDDTVPKLNYFFIHCRPNLNMFANNILYDSQIYGDCVHHCLVERVLPTPVESI